jgi:hypothetical protein
VRGQQAQRGQLIRVRLRRRDGALVPGPELEDCVGLAASSELGSFVTATT